MILKQNTFNVVVETVSSSEISLPQAFQILSENLEHLRIENPNPIDTNLTSELRAAREFVFKVIYNLSQVIDFYWSINNVWHVG